ncbi:MAG: orotate phosphoribosyltransferase [Bacillota bacterium]
MPDKSELAPLAPNEVLQLLRDSDVLMEGHFQLTSGRHSDRFMQTSRVWQHPERAARLGQALAGKVLSQLGAAAFRSVMGPAMGGIILGYEVARALRLRAIYAEKEGDRMVIKRGFQVSPGERFLVVEDALTTGGSVLKAIEALQAAGGVPVAVGVAVDRSRGRLSLGVPMISLMELGIPSYEPRDCPLCRAGLPLVRPKAMAAGPEWAGRTE